MVHNGHEVPLRPGDLVLTDTSRHYRGWRGPGPHPSLWLRIPRETLPVSGPAVDKVLGVPLCGRIGIGALVTGFMTNAVRDVDMYGPADAPRLSATLLDLVAALLTHQFEADTPMAPEPGHRILLHRVRAFIE